MADPFFNMLLMSILFSRGVMVVMMMMVVMVMVMNVVKTLGGTIDMKIRMGMLCMFMAVILRLGISWLKSLDAIVFLSHGCSPFVF
ncbi:hypothetical protein A8L34_18705 [Bacillus sp. FJAT-27264]|nr:hypothetical protein A8L34_18705 [Bacillus sp. FJAT-27264]